MKRFPEKAVMTAIILSCGFVMNADPAARFDDMKRLSHQARNLALRVAAEAARDVDARPVLLSEAEPVPIGQFR